LTSREAAPKSATKFRVGAELELAFTDLLANGQAVGRTGNLVVFCFGPLPQERARVRITTLKQKYAIAELVKLVEGSKFRVQPFCAVFGACGGCQVQHLSYPAQLAWKTDMVRNALRRIGGFSDIAIRDTVGMITPRAYRNKMSLVVDHQTATPNIGFYQQRSHDVVPIDHCPIVMPQLNEFINRFNSLRLNDQVSDVLQPARHIVSRAAKATGQAVVTITTATPSKTLEDAGPAVLAQLPGAVGVTNSFDLTGQNAIMGRRHRVVAGRADIEEVIHGVRYRVSAGSFFQVNIEMVSRIFEFMRSALAHPRSIVDLYCGAGTFSLYFAKFGCSVYGIEESPQAVLEAQSNAALNQTESLLKFNAGRVEDMMRKPETKEALAGAEIVFLDPPRKGSDEETLAAIADAGVPYVWYLSCDPATLARDLKFLAAKDYKLGIVQPFDMFPQTGHVETLVTLYREASVALRSIRDAFIDAPIPSWPADGPFAEHEPEYPDFVIREN
jgi:23S rRNA (uracil1939-C5)-methyltransferase